MEVRKAIAAGANINARNSFGLTVLDYAADPVYPHPYLRRLLIKSGAKCGALRTEKGEIPAEPVRESEIDQQLFLHSGQRVTWVSGTTEGKEFQGKKVYWLQTGNEETMEGIIGKLGELSSEVKVTKGSG